jgi:hypothetical protein
LVSPHPKNKLGHSPVSAHLVLNRDRSSEEASVHKEKETEMHTKLLTLVFTAGMATALAADPQAEPLTVHLAARGSGGLVEMLPNLSRERGTLEGFRGCSNGRDECEDSARFRAARAYPMPGESLILFVAGTQPVDRIGIKRNGITVLEQKDVTTPTELNLGAATEGEVIVAVVERGSESVELAVNAENARGVPAKASATSSAASGYITNYVYVNNGSCSTGWYEVIEGSGTGGRCTSYYTDRAQRGELIWAFYDGSGYTVVGWKYLGSGRTYNLGPVYLPFDRQFQVSTNASDDYLYTFITGVVQKRIPIGTRPR